MPLVCSPVDPVLTQANCYIREHSSDYGQTRGRYQTAAPSSVASAAVGVAVSEELDAPGAAWDPLGFDRAAPDDDQLFGSSTSDFLSCASKSSDFSTDNQDTQSDVTMTDLYECDANVSDECSDSDEIKLPSSRASSSTAAVAAVTVAATEATVTAAAARRRTLVPASSQTLRMYYKARREFSATITNTATNDDFEVHVNRSISQAGRMRNSNYKQHRRSALAGQYDEEEDDEDEEGLEVEDEEDEEDEAEEQVNAGSNYSRPLPRLLRVQNQDRRRHLGVRKAYAKFLKAEPQLSRHQRVRKRPQRYTNFTAFGYQDELGDEFQAESRTSKPRRRLRCLAHDASGRRPNSTSCRAYGDDREVDEGRKAGRFSSRYSSGHGSPLSTPSASPSSSPQSSYESQFGRISSCRGAVTGSRDAPYVPGGDVDSMDCTVAPTRRRHLLHFIVELLNRRQGCVEWVDRNDRVFQISDPDQLTQLWGQYKKNFKMTFESLSRSLRLYYAPKKLERIQGRRHQYRLLHFPTRNRSRMAPSSRGRSETLSCSTSRRAYPASHATKSSYSNWY